MIPPFEPGTGNLPPGVHEATWEEVVERFGYTGQRSLLLEKLRQALDLLHSFECGRFYLNGSFVTAKLVPGDYDGCWDIQGVDIPLLVRLHPLLWDDSRGRRNQKAEYGGDLFPVQMAGDPSDRRIFEDFQLDPNTRAPKGIIALDLGSLR